MRCVRFERRRLAARGTAGINPAARGDVGCAVVSSAVRRRALARVTEAFSLRAKPRAAEAELDFEQLAEGCEAEAWVEAF